MRFRQQFLQHIYWMRRESYWLGSELGAAKNSQYVVVTLIEHSFEYACYRWVQSTQWLLISPTGHG